jgi:hypothetical protein
LTLQLTVDFTIVETPEKVSEVIMSRHIKTVLGSTFVVITLLIATTGSAVAESGGCGCCKKMQQSAQMQQSTVSPDRSYSPGYIRGK